MPAVFNPLQLAATALDVVAASHATPAAIAARQQVRLSRLLYILAQSTSLYRHHLRDYLDPGVQLQSLPVISKHELMQRFEEWVTDPELKLADLRAFTADPQRIAQPFLGKYMVWESSGSGGEPGIFVQDAAVMAVYDALEALRRSPPRPMLRWLDPLCMSERIAFVGATSGHFASIVSVRRLQELNPWTAPFIRSVSIMQPMARVVEELNAFAPTILATYPTVAATLADHKASGSLTIAPLEVWTGGETLSGATRKRIAQTLGCTVRNQYGASEFLTIAFECAHGQLHANADWVVLEPVDEKYLPVPPGQPAHTTLLTNLANTVQPLIRYDIGDQITLGSAPCACGSPLPVIAVAGRNDHILNLRDPHGAPVAVLPMALTTALEEEGGVFDFQVRQKDAESLELFVAQADEAQAQHAATALTDFLQMQGVAPMRIILRAGAQIQRGRSGKAPRVVAI